VSPLKNWSTCILSLCPAIPSPSWSVVVWYQLAATHFSLLGYPQGLLHGRKDLVLQQLPVAELVDPHLVAKLVPKMLIYV
jgi:hypothetical protein